MGDPAIKAALMADAVKLATQYQVAPEMMGVYSAIKSGNERAIQKATKKLMDTVMQEGHPLSKPLRQAMPELLASVEAGNPEVIGQAIDKLIGKKGMPKGAVRDLIAQLKPALEQTTAHGMDALDLLNAKQTPARKAILREVVETHLLPKAEAHIAALGTFGLPTEKAHETLAKLEAKLLKGVDLSDGAVKPKAAPAAKPDAKPKATPSAEAKPSAKPASAGVASAKPTAAAAKPKARTSSGGGRSYSYSGSSTPSTRITETASKEKGVLSFLGEHAGWKAAGIGAAAVAGGFALKHVLQRREEQQNTAQSER
jgi:hypothetical protein